MTSKEQKLKDLLLQVYTDVYTDEIDEAMKRTSDLIETWNEEQLDNLLKFIKEEKERGKQKTGKGNRGRKKQPADKPDNGDQ